jgi:hypothetical protein
MSRSRMATFVLVGVLLVVVAGLLVRAIKPVPIAEQQQGQGGAEAPSLLTGGLGLGALVGALAGAAATHLLAETRRQRQKDREKAGLLRLVLIELRMNELVLQEVRDGPNLVLEGRKGMLSQKAWESVRVRLAHLLPKEDYETIAYYYEGQQGTILTWEEIAEEEIADDSDEDEITFRQKMVEVHAKHLLRECDRVLDTIEKHLKDREREYPSLPVGARPRNSPRSWVARPLMRLTTFSASATCSSTMKLLLEKAAAYWRLVRL